MPEEEGGDAVNEPWRPLPLGTKTRWGKIAAVGTVEGERYYWMIRPGKPLSVAMIPAIDVEAMR